MRNSARGVHAIGVPHIESSSIGGKEYVLMEFVPLKTKATCERSVIKDGESETVEAEKVKRLVAKVYDRFFLWRLIKYVHKHFRMVLRTPSSACILRSKSHGALIAYFVLRRFDS